MANLYTLLKHIQSKMIYLKTCFLVISYLFFISDSTAQEDCILGVGITDNETIIDVFQLNAEQSEQMINFSAELKYRNELLNNQAEHLMKNHPQSTQAELMVLADKYNMIRDSMERIQRMLDIRVLKLFNTKQYERYLELCNEAYRQPLRVIPVSLLDSIPPK